MININATSKPTVWITKTYTLALFQAETKDCLRTELFILFFFIVSKVMANILAQLASVLLALSNGKILRSKQKAGSFVHALSEGRASLKTPAEAC